MEFLYIKDLDHFELSGFNIPEPPASNEVAKDPRVLIIMPGVAFDPDLNRIGYGGGYYDKYLSNHPDVLFTKVAITYDFQIVDSLPTEPHDYKVDMVVTPTKTLLPK
jgi:5-formyltetrahydrofolate cyclo-ligase